MMESASRSSRGFPDDDEEFEDEFVRREGSSQKVDLTVKVDGKNVDQKQPSTPRSKHSATEQRRRSKINDRFQILRDLIPHSDQKRDKASFLLEVIEYIRFLQEKVPKCETYPEMPWVKTFSRSLWKNARNNAQGSGDGITDPHLIIKNAPAPPGYMFSGNDNSISVAPAMLSNVQNPAESEVSPAVPYEAMENPSDFLSKVAPVQDSLQPNLYASVGRGTGFTQPQQRLISDSNNLAAQSQSQWLRPSCPVDCTVSSDRLNEQEELTIDEGTISVSHTYSQGLLATLTQSLESSGLDLSQASISVQISLGKRAKRPATITTSSPKDHDDPSSGNRAMGHSVVGSSGEESEQASKRHKSDNS